MLNVKIGNQVIIDLKKKRVVKTVEKQLPQPLSEVPECPVCLDTKPLLNMAPCKHTICKNCFMHLHKTVCPLCRRDVDRLMKPGESVSVWSKMRTIIESPPPPPPVFNNTRYLNYLMQGPEYELLPRLRYSMYRVYQPRSPSDEPIPRPPPDPQNEQNEDTITDITQLMREYYGLFPNPRSLNWRVRIGKILENRRPTDTQYYERFYHLFKQLSDDKLLIIYRNFRSYRPAVLFKDISYYFAQFEERRTGIKPVIRVNIPTDLIAKLLAYTVIVEVTAENYLDRIDDYFDW